MSRMRNVLQITPLLLVVMLPLVAAPCLSQSATPPAASTPTTTKTPKQVGVHGKEEEGERIFAQNCARCHNAPDGFSPRVSGTVVRHMRVRASLSKHDEEELLRFFNP